MGLDAPSNDLTARIQARRRALVLSGEVDPALPGEHAIHGRQPNAAAAFETSGAAIAQGAARRASRAAASEVVELVYTDEERAAMDAADADEPFAIGEEPEPDEEALLAEAEQAHEALDVEREFAERVIHDDGGLLHLADVVEGSENRLHFRMDEYDRGLIALAQGVGEEFAALRQELRDAFTALAAAVAAPAEPVSPRGFFSRLFG